MQRVLIVDDTIVFREPIAATLKKQGYHVTCAGTGAEALKVLQFQTPNIILLDVAMPEMDGLTFLKRLRTTTEFTDVPVILLTAVAEKDYVLRAKELGATDYLVKSYFSLEELLQKVRTTLENSRATMHGETSVSAKKGE